jgi:Xaa-Pro aminopeptidase
MERDAERMERVVAALRDGGYDALICALPANVLLLTGYWPVIGSAIAIATREGRVAILAPADEHELAQAGWADDVHTCQPGGRSSSVHVCSAAAEPLAELLRVVELAGP